MPRTGQPSTRDVEATMRAVAILDALAEGGELGTTDLARRTGISASTVSRQLGTLSRVGLVEHIASNGRYRLGVRVLTLANAVLGRLDLRDLARPQLEELVEAVDETATLSVPGDGDAITVDFVPTDRYVQGVTRLGRPSVGHASSAGKVLLAFGDVPLPRGRLERFTPRTIVDTNALASEIDRVRAGGVAEALEEREEGLNAVAAPIWGSDGRLAAIVALQGPSARFDRPAIDAARPLLLACARSVSRALGWSNASAAPDSRL
jgi:DNA-binding IclR family transcriptional regulator